MVNVNVIGLCKWSMSMSNVQCLMSNVNQWSMVNVNVNGHCQCQCQWQKINDNGQCQCQFQWSMSMSIVYVNGQ